MTVRSHVQSPFTEGEKALNPPTTILYVVHHLQMIGDRSNSHFYLLHYEDIFGDSIVLLLLGTQVCFLASQSEGSELPIFLGPADLMHSSGLVEHHICK